MSEQNLSTWLKVSGSIVALDHFHRHADYRLALVERKADPAAGTGEAMYQCEVIRLHRAIRLAESLGLSAREMDQAEVKGCVSDGHR